jgi:hypothetical protein
MSPEDIRRLINPPGFGAGVTIDPPEPLIFVPNPVPVPDKDVLPIPEFNFPTHTGAPPQIVNAGPHITPVPDELPVGLTVLHAISVKDLEKGSGGWQRPVEPTNIDDLKQRQPWIGQVESNFGQAVDLAGGQRAGESAQEYGKRVHKIFEGINDNDQILRDAGVKAEVTVTSEGKIGPDIGRPAGSQVLDVMVIKDRILYFPDGKTGRNGISNSYLRELALKLGDKIDKIVAMTVKN